MRLTMKVAFGKITITPENYIGMTLAGYTPIPECTGKLDDVFAHGVLIEAIEVGNVPRRLLLLSLDILGLTMAFSNYVKEQIQKHYAIAPGQILIHAVHTHKSPIDTAGIYEHKGGVLNVIKRIMCPDNKRDQILVWVTHRIILLVGHLLQNLTPSKMAWAQERIARSDVVINRRHPIRQTRPNVGVIAFRALKDDHLIGFLMHFACHGTTLSYKITEISADWMGRAVAYVEEHTGGGVETAYFNGPSGDLNPITTCGTDFEYLQNLKKRTILYDQLGTYKSTNRIGHIVGAQALRLARGIPIEEFLPNLRFRAYTKIYWVPMDDYRYFNAKTWFQNKAYFLLKKYLALRVALTHEKLNFPSFAIKHRGFGINLYTMIQWLRITLSSADGAKSKELSILTAPGELFEDIGKSVRKKCPTYPNVWISQNSHDWNGYLFSQRDYQEQAGYEPIISFSSVSGLKYQQEFEKLFDEVAAGVNSSYS
jgi:hypothetical protein